MLRPIPTFKEYLHTLASQASTLDTGQDQAATIKSIAEPFSRLTSTVFFMLDYSTSQYQYMDSNVLRIMGHPPLAFIEGGVDFTMAHCHPQDLIIYNSYIFPSRLDFLSNSIGDSEDYRFTHSFRIRRANGVYEHILQHSTVKTQADRLGPIAVLGSLSTISHQKGNGIIRGVIEKRKPDGQWEPVISKHYLTDSAVEKLMSQREVEILTLIREGYTSQQISDRLHISLHTVNTHRKNILEKTNSQNIMEVVKLAISLGILAK
mgnify:CR=1 FL=1